MPITQKSSRFIEIAVHVLAWSYVFLSPFLFHHPHEGIVWERVVNSTLFSLILFAVFYLNYFWFIPRYFLQKRNWPFYGVNLVLLVAFAALFEVIIITQIFGLFSETGIFAAYSKGAMQGRPPRPAGPMTFKFVFFVRNLVSIAFIWGAAIAVCLSIRWKESQRALNEAELGRTAAELVNLKTQISPHFLLNTLNNIYSLTSFDTEKAQAAILELSRMLRYQLYESSDRRVSLGKEVDFLNNYIALMRLRLTNNVEVETDFEDVENCSVGVAPHLFISLVENAFKHGVSPVQKSYIRMSLRLQDGKICFLCQNSNYPKLPTDKTPGGIGLSLIERRLKLSYPKDHTWKHGVSDDGLEYSAELILPALPLDDKKANA